MSDGNSNGNGSDQAPRFSEQNLARVIWLLNILNDRLARIARDHGLMESPLGAALKTMLQEAVNRSDGVADDIGRYFLPAESLGHFDRDNFDPRVAGDTKALRDAILRNQWNRDVQYSVPFDISLMRYLVKIVAAWTTDPAYRSKNGELLDIALLGDTPSLQALNEKNGCRYPVQQLADELQRYGNCDIIQLEDKRHFRLRLVESAINQIPRSDEGFAVLAQMCIDFLYSLQNKLSRDSEDVPYFRTSYFIDIREEVADEVLLGLRALQREFGMRSAQYIANFRDSSGKGVRVGVGSFTFQGSPSVLNEFDSEGRKVF